MRHLLAAACLVWAASLPWSGVRAADCPAPALHAALLGNLVKVNQLPDADGGNGKEGFGFVIDADADGYTVVTARHVIARGRRGEGEVGDRLRVAPPPLAGAGRAAASGFGESFPATPLSPRSPALAKRFAGRDVALLRIGKDVPLRFAPAVLGPGSVAEGESLCIAGQPRTGSRDARPRLTNQPFDVFERTDNPIAGPRFVLGGVRPVVDGHSGAPAFGERGIVGMVTRKSSGNGLALEIDEIRRLVKSDARTFGLTPSPTPAAPRAPSSGGGVPRAVWVVGTVLAGALLAGLAMSGGGGGGGDDGGAATTLVVPTP